MRIAPAHELDINYSAYEALKANGLNAAEVCSHAALDGKDWTFQIRMLRAVFDIDLVEAREIVLPSQPQIKGF